MLVTPKLLVKQEQNSDMDLVVESQFILLEGLLIKEGLLVWT